MTKIFISYRREDSSFAAQTLYRALTKTLDRPGDKVFIDVDGIDLGTDFASSIETNVGQCDVLLAVIGHHWLNAADKDTKQRRLDNAQDWVRLEIAAALKRNIRVVPVLLDNAPMPQERDLPSDLSSLVQRQAIDLRSKALDADIPLMIRGLRLRKSRPNWGLFVGLSAAALALVGGGYAVMELDRGDTSPSPAISTAGPNVAAANVGTAPIPGETANTTSDAVLAPPQPGTTLRKNLEVFRHDCEGCPEMIALPGAEAFVIGSDAGTPGTESLEHPKRTIRIEPFALSRDEVTFELWELCMVDGPCAGVSPGESDPQLRGHPVYSITWNAITTKFIPWLNGETGKRYRLPSEAEWEYAARAGGKVQGPYYWQGAPEDGCRYGNLYDLSAEARMNLNAARTAIKCDDGWPGTAPVGSYPANPWGLRDMFGNVSEWVQDCFVSNYEKLPLDGTPYEEAGCERRGIRGGSWVGRPEWVRIAVRDKDRAVQPNRGMGFRLAHDLPD